MLPAPDADVFLDWPDNSPEDQEEIFRDETIPSYRISEETMPSGPVDIEPALEAVYRTFLEEQPPLLAFHLRREEFMGLNTPGYTPGWVISDLLLNRLTVLFATRRTISLEYVRPRALADGRIGVKAWYTYRDRAGNVYRSHLRFVLKPLNGRLILTSFTLE